MIGVIGASSSTSNDQPASSISNAPAVKSSSSSIQITPAPKSIAPAVSTSRDFDEAKNVSVSIPKPAPVVIPATPLPPAPAPTDSAKPKNIISPVPILGTSTVYIKEEEPKNNKSGDTELYIICGSIMLSAIAYITYAKIFRQPMN